MRCRGPEGLTTTRSTHAGQRSSSSPTRAVRRARPSPSRAARAWAPSTQRTRPPAIHALDTDQSVIYCGTFSKTIAPALRVGYLVAPWPLMGRILPLKTDAGSGALEQMVLAEYLPENFDAHVAALLPMLQEKSDTLCAALDEHFGAAAEYTRPEGGIYLWVTLPDNVDTDRLYQAALQHGIEFNPGSQWTVNGAENRHRLRICFGHPSLDTIKDGIAKLADVCFAEFGVPVRSGNLDRG